MDPRSIEEGPSDVVLRRNVAVVGASAGGVEALSSLVRGLPADVPLAVVAVLHLPTGANSRLAEILGRAGPLEAAQAEHGQAIREGTVTVAPPDYHLVISDERLFLLDGARENGFRPAIDPLFRSAARALGPRVIGVILSGTMDDGAAGLAAIRSFGGATVVQHPDDALASGMPEAALDAVDADHVLPATSMGAVLDEIARTEVEVDHPALQPRPPGRAGTSEHVGGPGDMTLIAEPLELPPRGVDLACPECGGALQEIRAGRMARFRCRTGHVYSPVTLLETKGTELEAALWAALRALEEEATVSGRLAVRSRESGAPLAARRFETRQGNAAQRADLIRQALASIGRVSDEEAPQSTERVPGVVRA